MSSPRRHRLSSYLAAAVVAVAIPASAEVITSAPELYLGAGGSDPLTTVVDINADGTNDFSFTHSTVAVDRGDDLKNDYNGKLTLDQATTTQMIAIVKDADGVQSASFNLPGYLGNYAETLAIGTVVGPASTLIDIDPLSGSGYDNRLLDSTNDGDGGAFSTGTAELPPLTFPLLNVAYVGFKLGDNYGYLEFTNVDNDTLEFFGTDFNAARLSGIAFETTPNTAIVVNAITVPEPTSLAVLGLGAVALLGRRRGAR